MIVGWSPFEKSNITATDIAPFLALFFAILLFIILLLKALKKR